MSTPHVYTAICAVMADIGTTGISKARKNQQQGYSFRGIDDVYNELNHLLAKHSLIMTPRILSREVVERQTQKGGALFNVAVEAEFDFISAQDGSKHTVRTYGEAMDSADKATNKAMSAAYKYAAMMVFCIPTEGDNDADAITHDVAPRQSEQAPKRVSAAEMKRGLEAITQDLLDCHTTADAQAVWKAWSATMKAQNWTVDYIDIARDRIQERGKELKAAQDAFPGDIRTNQYAQNVAAG